MNTDRERPTIPVPLPDGMEMGIRPIVATDADLVSQTFSEMSDQSRYQRFFSPVDELSSHDLKYLTEMDGSTRFAWGARINGRSVGVARFVRFSDEPLVADVAIGIVDDFHHHGIGNALVRCLGPVADLVGIEKFSFDVLPSNTPMLNLLRSIQVTMDHDGRIQRGRVKVNDLPPPPVDPDLLLTMVQEVVSPVVRKIP
ncbi:MAG: hypothetical protein GEU79_08050 [Acidimicrobiia bacterium]|nr:hypothetical protein [Acidimicrobiia bacterium]